MTLWVSILVSNNPLVGAKAAVSGKTEGKGGWVGEKEGVICPTAGTWRVRGLGIRVQGLGLEVVFAAMAFAFRGGGLK